MFRFLFGVAVGGGLAVTFPQLQALFMRMMVWFESTGAGQWIMSLV